MSTSRTGLWPIKIQQVFERYCPPDHPAYRILAIHSQLVAEKALGVCSHLKKTEPFSTVDTVFIQEASLLHDIGIVLVKAPELGCHGKEPYLRHGLLGAQLLRDEGLYGHARVAERHTGVGLTAREIADQNLPLPHQDFIPESDEEIIICYADCFYSKNPNRLETIRTPDEVRQQLAVFGKSQVALFNTWHARFCST